MEFCLLFLHAALARTLTHVCLNYSTCMTFKNTLAQEHNSAYLSNCNTLLRTNYTNYTIT